MYYIYIYIIYYIYYLFIYIYSSPAVVMPVMPLIFSYPPLVNSLELRAARSTPASHVAQRIPIAAVHCPGSWAARGARGARKSGNDWKPGPENNSKFYLWVTCNSCQILKVLLSKAWYTPQENHALHTIFFENGWSMIFILEQSLRQLKLWTGRTSCSKTQVLVVMGK